MFSTIPEILADLSAGKMVILTDDEARENEGDLVLPAQFVTPEAITFMLSVARGYMCLSMTAADCDRLDLPPQAHTNTSARGTPFTVSIDGHPKHGFTTGVSAKERARTIKLAIDPTSKPDDFVRPGHINPLRSRDGGVLVRTGQTEGSLDLCRLAGLYPAAVIIEIMRDDGEMARLPDLERLCAQHGLKMCSVPDLIGHRLARESLVRRVGPPASTRVRTALGEFDLIAFETPVDPLPHIALTVGGVGGLDAQGRVRESSEPTLVRVHRRHLLGDVFGDLDSSREGPTGATLRGAMKLIHREGRGAIVYLRPEGGSEWAGEGPVEPRLQTIRRSGYGQGWAQSVIDPVEPGTTAPSSIREYGIGSQICRALGLRRLRLLTNHQTDLPGLDAFGLEIVERVAVTQAG